MASQSPTLSPLGSPTSGHSSLHLVPPPNTGCAGETWDYFSSWHDPRTSSMQSLAPSLVSEPDDEEAQGGRAKKRILLVIYIHGYNGNNQSFRSFPAHVHQYLKTALVDSHRIHSKIYPRYKTYRAMQVGVDNFSEWLRAAEGGDTDVVLMGHSMGGILAGEVVLMPNTDPYSRRPYKHRILGMLGMDTPYLGLHPGIISSGIASIFRGAPEDAKQPGQDLYSADHTVSAPDLGQQSPRPSTTLSDSTQTSSTELTSLATSISSQSPSEDTPSDPLFDPRWANDTVYKERPFFKGMAHFAKKHFSEGVVNAAAKHFLSHFEYASTLMNYEGLKTRYDSLRALEDVDDLKELANPEQTTGPSFRPSPCRVRFANYYTISTGIPKKPKPTSRPVSTGPYLRPEDAADLSPESQVSTPRISIEAPDGVMTRPALEEITADNFEEPSRIVSYDSTLSPVDESEEITPPKPNPLFPEEDPDAGLPAVPAMPTPPPDPNLDQYTDKETRKQAEKEARRLQKVYDQSLKNRAKAIKERARIAEKRRRKAAKESEKREKDVAKAQLRREGVNTDLYGGGERNSNSKTTLVANSTAAENPPEADHENRGRQPSTPSASTEPKKPKKERKFCALPKKINGVRDETWVKVFMKDVDEVGAHCGLFVPGEHYHTLVSDVAERIVGWVHEDMSRREIVRIMEVGDN